MTTKSKAKTVKKKPVKSKTESKVLKKKKPVATKSKVSKPAAKAVKAVKKPLAKPTAVKKPAVKAKAPAKPVIKAAAPAKPVKVVKVVVAKAPKVTKSRKKITKMDKKMARTLVKIANSNKTAVASVGVQSAAMAALRATVAMNTASANRIAANNPQPANINVQPKETKPAEKPIFKAGDVVVYPAHGVGKVDGVEAHTIGGNEVKLFKISFDHERMTLRVPVARATGSGLRQLSSKETMKSVFETMKGRPRVRRVMWSRRAQEYEQKINSGDPVAIAEVLRDLRRNAESGDQSYSERQIFQNALERLAREVAAIDKIDQEKAVEKLHSLLVRKVPAAANNDEADAA